MGQMLQQLLVLGPIADSKYEQESNQTCYEKS